jgi:hypothetical protein
MPELMGADLPQLAKGRCSYMGEGPPSVAAGPGVGHGNKGRTRVFTIVITALQQGHKIGGRSFRGGGGMGIFNPPYGHRTYLPTYSRSFNVQYSALWLCL